MCPVSDNHGNRLDPYQVLGVDPAANERQIRRAYRALAKQHHPDRGGDAARFDQITKAFKQLSDLDFSPPTTVPAPGQAQRTRPVPRPAPKATDEPVVFIPPLADGPLRVASKPPVTVDSLIAQQIVHGSLPGGLLGRKQRALHGQLSEVLVNRVHGALPAVRIFHGVKLSRKLTLDTVLLGGSKAAVLGAVYAPPEVYRFNGSQLQGRKRIVLPDLTESVTELQRLLPDIAVGGFMVVFSDSPHAPTIQATDALNTLGLTEVPASIMDAVRDIKFFIGTGDPTVVDRTAMGHLLSKL